MKKHSNSVKESESPMKRRNPRAEERRDSSEMMAELVSQLRQQLEEKSVPAAEAAGEDRDVVGPNLDRLTVGVDLGDQWSNYCILGLGRRFARASFGRGGRKLKSSSKAWRCRVWLSKWERIRRGYGN